MLILKNCRIPPSDTELFTILIENGIIEEVGKSVSSCGHTVDIAGNYVLPGVIDSHVHSREPGFSYKEDWLSLSAAAALGGITTVIDMPNTLPPVFNSDALMEKSLCASKSLVNYGFHFGASASDNTEEILKNRNIASVKVFMNHSTGNLLITDDTLLENVFRSSPLISAHAEGEMLKKAVQLSHKTKTPLYLCHISTAEEISFLKQHKTPEIYCEATPHHLAFSDALLNEQGAFAKVLPALKSENDRQALLTALQSGLIDTIGSDHAPHTKDEKMSDTPPSGMPGLETMLPFLLNAVNTKLLTLSRVIELTSENPSRIFNIAGRGKIKPGYYADLTIVDMNMEKTVSKNMLATKCHWSCFEGISFKGWPVMTIVNGNIVMHNGKLFSNRGFPVLYSTEEK